tara:strand:+ start:372 stop:515 length:144 start_codon:yes stop_codon:yes gene_type:complete
MIRTKIYKVDGDTTVGIWVDGVFKQELTTHSQLSTREAKATLLEQYK